MKLILRAVTSPYDDITKGSVLSHQELDNNLINLKGELIYTANSENNVITFQKINGGTIEVPFNGGGSGSTEITDFSYNGLNTLTITDSNGNIFTADINTFSGLTINGGLSATTISGDGSRITNILANKLWTSGSTGSNSIKANNSTTTNATGTYAIATGYNTLASGYASFSKGFGTIASGDASSAEGYYTVAGDDGAHAEGVNTNASGIYSHAQNQANTASGKNSHAGGSGSTASGNVSFVHGVNSRATGVNTIVLGSNITGTSANKTYVEKLNIRDINYGTPINNLAFDVNGNIINGVQTTGFTFNNGNYNLSIFNSDNTSFTQNLGILSSDMTITGGTYNPNTGVGTFVNNSGGTFDVSGFLTGQTDTFIVSGTSDNYTGTVTLKRSDNADIIINGLTSGTSINWYAENTNPPLVAPVATGVGSIAIGNNASALSSDMFVYGDSAGLGSMNTFNSNFIGGNAGGQADGAEYSNFIGYNAGNSAIGAYYSNFIGYGAGNSATDATGSNFIGSSAGNGAINSYNSNFLGQGAGEYATGATHSNFIGYNAGSGAIDVGFANFIGYEAGKDATGNSGSVFIGTEAGKGASDATGSIFIGESSGNIAKNSLYSNFIGGGAGGYATGATGSNFIGRVAGSNANDTVYSNFIGMFAGSNTNNVTGSNFIGHFAGQESDKASYSNLFGYYVGNAFSNNQIGSNNIIIGTNISLPSGATNSINLGGVLFGTGTYMLQNLAPATPENQSIVPTTNGKIGVGIVTPLEKLHVNGNTRVEGGLIIKTFTGGTALNNIGVDVNGNVVSGITAYNIFRYLSNNQIVTGTTGGIFRGDSISVTGATAYFNSTRNNGTSLGASMGHIGSIGNTNVSSYLQLFSNTANGNAGPNNIIGSYSGSSSTEAQLNFSATKNATYNGFGATSALLFSFRDSYIAAVPKFNIGTDFIDFLSYPTTRVDTGTTSNYLATDSTGRLTSKPISGIVFTGGTVTGNTNFTGNLSANTLTSTNIKITLPTITGSTGEIVYFGSGSGLSAGLIYYFNSSGQWTVANATTSTSSKYLIGIALGTSITDGMLIRGYAKYSVGNYSSVGTGDILYLGTTNGFFQTTAPSNSSEVVRVIGYCIDSANDIIYFNPDNTWVEIL